MARSILTAAALAVPTTAAVLTLAGCGAPATSPPTAPASVTGAGTLTRTGPAHGYRDGTYRGSLQRYKHGSAQVSVVVAHGAIEAVTAELVAENGLSTQIQEKAEPMLRDRVLAADSADIATISGATYTSKAYRTSLQAALDQAN